MKMVGEELARMILHEAIFGAGLGQHEIVPADLLALARSHLAAQRAGEQLGAEAETRNRLALRHEVAAKLNFSGKIRISLRLVGALRAAEHDEAREHVARKLGIVRFPAEHASLRKAAFGDQVRQGAGTFMLIVLDDENRFHCPMNRTAYASLPSAANYGPIYGRPIIFFCPRSWTRS